MKKEYVSRLTLNEEWEIIKLAIAKKDIALIRKLLRDGYSLTVPLLEAVYRFMDQASLMLVVNSYPDDLTQEDDCMLFLRECLDEHHFDTLMANNTKKLEKLALERQIAKQEQIIEIIENAEQKWGKTSEFYEFVCECQDTFEYAISKYGEDAMFTEMDKLGVLYKDENRNEYEAWYLRGFGFEYLMSHNHIQAAAVWLTSATSVHNIPDYDNALLRVAKAGGLKKFITYRTPLGLGSLLEDEAIRAEVKAMGAIGYQKLYFHAKEYFTLDDWYKWYELDAKAALKRCKQCKVPKFWLLKHGHLLHALGLK